MNDAGWCYQTGRAGLAAYLGCHGLARSLWFQVTWCHMTFIGIGVLIGMGPDRDNALSILIGSLLASLVIYLGIWLWSVRAAALARYRIQQDIQLAVNRIIFEAGEEGG
jgi:hypothetical protein